MTMARDCLLQEMPNRALAWSETTGLKKGITNSKMTRELDAQVPPDGA